MRLGCSVRRRPREARQHVACRHSESQRPSWTLGRVMYSDQRVEAGVFAHHLVAIGTSVRVCTAIGTSAVAVVCLPVPASALADQKRSVSEPPTRYV